MTPSRRARTIATALAAFFLLWCVGVQPASGQARPRFAGAWQLVEVAPALDVTGLDEAYQSMDVEQSTTALVVTTPRVAPLAPLVTTYKLDGTLSANAMANGDQVRSKVRWQGEALIADGIGALGEEVITIRETWRLDAGETLVVETETLTNLGGARARRVARYRRR